MGASSLWIVLAFNAMWQSAVKKIINCTDNYRKETWIWVMAEDFFSLPLSQVSYCITWKGNVRVRLGHSQPYATLMAHRNKVFKKTFFSHYLCLASTSISFFSTVVQSCTFKTVNSQCMSIFSLSDVGLFLNTVAACCLQIFISQN